jgi:hypothetical protein
MNKLLPEQRDNPWLALTVLVAAVTIAVVSARDYAGGWNDGSRLATVECLVDQGTLAIDDSIFVQVPPATNPAVPSPYPADDPGLLRHGTGDKLLIHGNFYSDKSPVPALWMAGVYKGLQWCSGLKARDRPDHFCYALTLASSGLAYVVAVWCLYQLGRALDLPVLLRLGLTASFALGTVALPYCRHVNNHILLLGVAAALVLGLIGLARECAAGAMPWFRLVGLGSLAGLGYSIDLGAGPVLLVCTCGVVAYRCRRPGSVAVFVAAALPWLVLHHAVNYAIGGTFKPANAVPEYFLWPGCTFKPQNLTGFWNHRSFGRFLVYEAGLLGGKKGFLGHNLALLLALPGMVALLRWRGRELPEILFAGCTCVGIWLAYALTSTNSSGLCCSVRWFVPLLAPGYLVLGLSLRQHPLYCWDFLVLSGWATVLAGIMWWKGPWIKHMVPLYWPLVAAALVSWIGCAVRRRRRQLPAARVELCGSKELRQAA